MATDDDTRAGHRSGHMSGHMSGHAVPEGVRALEDAVVALAQRPLFALDADATAEALLAITDLESRLAAYKLSVAAHAGQVGVGAQAGATSAGVWWAVATRQRRSSVAGQVRLGAALEARWHRVGAALGEAAMNLEQARVIVHALEDLPEDLDPDLLVRAEQTLVEHARVFDPGELAVLGARILGVVAPEVGEEVDRRRLEEAERQAAQRRRLTLSFDGHGAAHGRFQLPTAQAKMLEKLLLAFAAPGHLHTTPGHDGDKRVYVKGRPTAQKMGEAFAELIETYPRASAPTMGRVSGTFIATMTLESLTTGLGAATLDDGTQMSPCEARRQACTARIIPAVLGSDGEVLDLGRAVRLFTPGQTYALHLRDGGCTAQGCDWPPGLCHAHHDIPWHLGGPTDVKNGRLLCPHHHARAHDPTYDMTIQPDNQVTFHRRP